MAEPKEQRIAFLPARKYALFATIALVIFLLAVVSLYLENQSLKEHLATEVSEVKELTDYSIPLQDLKDRLEANATICRKDNGCNFLSPASSYLCDAQGYVNENGGYTCECSLSCDPFITHTR